MDELNLMDEFLRVTRLWWLVALAVFLGGLGGFLFHLAHPPLYEAAATIYIDFDPKGLIDLKIPADQYPYNEDLVLADIQRALMNPAVMGKSLALLKDQGINLSLDELKNNSTIERKHTLWELRYRSPDPNVSKTVANIWMEQGYQQVLQIKSANQGLSGYVSYEQPSPAALPSAPLLYPRGRLILAGSLLGLVGGILAANLLARKRAAQ